MAELAEGLLEDRARARRCVRLARDAVKDPSTRDWLDKDEMGTWEGRALDCLRRAPGIMAEKGFLLTDEEVDRQVAGVLAHTALSAAIEHARRHGGR